VHGLSEAVVGDYGPNMEYRLWTDCYLRLQIAKTAQQGHPLRSQQEAHGVKAMDSQHPMVISCVHVEPWRQLHSSLSPGYCAAEWLPASAGYLSSWQCTKQVCQHVSLHVQIGNSVFLEMHGGVQMFLI